MNRSQRDPDGAVGRRGRAWALLAALSVCMVVGWLGVAQAWAQPQRGGAGDEEFTVDRTRVAGSDRMLFAVQIDDDLREFKLRFAKADELDELLRGWRATGVVDALAAWQETAYLAYSDRSVQAMTRREPAPGQPQPFEIRQLPPLPRGGELVDFLAMGDRELAVVLGPAEDAPESGEREAPAAAELEVDLEADRDAAAEAEAEPETGAETEAAVEQPRLLRLVRNRWEQVDWPEGVDADDLLGLGGTPPGYVTVMSRSADGEAVDLHTWRAERPEEGWATERYAVESTAWVRSVWVRGMRVLVRAETAAGPFELYLARGGESRRLGELEAVDDAVGWWATPTGDRLTLVLIDGEQNLARWSWDLTGEAPGVDAVEPMELADIPAPAMEPVVWLLVVAMVVALLLLLVTMGNAEANMPRLPVSLRPAGTTRIWAALIDFAPAMAASMIIYGQDPGQILQYWPSLSGEWERMPPAATVIGIHALHTLVSEMFTGRSLGKWLMGCKVVDLTGEPPHVWQVGGRNFFKVLEMAVPWLLILPLLPSLRVYQQRLGDLIARTLVVVDVPVEEQKAIEEQRKKEGLDEEGKSEGEEAGEDRERERDEP